MFKSYGIHTRLYHILKRVCRPDKGLDLNNVCNLYNITLEDAKRLSKYGNTKEFIEENGLLYTISCTLEMEEKKEREYKQFKKDFAPMYSLASTLANEFLRIRR